MTATIHRFPARKPNRRPGSVPAAPPLPAPLFPGPDANWSLIAADLARIGGDPDQLFSLPGLDQETAAEMHRLMTDHAAAGVAAVLAASR